LKTGCFEKHYMLHDLLLMLSICCDNVPSAKMKGTEKTYRAELVLKGRYRKALRPAAFLTEG
jgi:hypothetical protein